MPVVVVIDGWGWVIRPRFLIITTRRALRLVTSVSVWYGGKLTIVELTITEECHK